MVEEDKKYAAIVPLSGTKSLTQLNKSLTVTYKLLYGDIEELFNKAFCLLNGFEVCDKNYLRIFETDPNHLLRNEYRFYTSEEDNSLVLNIIHEILKKKPDHILTKILILICRAKDLINYNDNSYDTAVSRYDTIAHEFNKLLIPESPKLLKSLVYYLRGIVNVLWMRYYSTDLIGHFDQYSANVKGSALEDFSKAIELAPNFLLAYRKRAKFSDSETAIKDLSKILEIDPEFNNEFGRIYFLRANAKFQIGDIEGAIDDYTSAISKYPSDEYHESRGWMYFQNKIYQNAITDFIKAIDLYPGNKDAFEGLISSYEYLAETHETSFDYYPAINIYSKIITLYNKNVNAFYKRGLLKNKLGIDIFIENINHVDADLNNLMILTMEEFGESIHRKSLRFEFKYKKVVAIFDNYREFHVSDFISENPFILEDTKNLYFAVPLKKERGRYIPLFDEANLTRTTVNRTNFLEKYSNICLLDKIYKEGKLHSNPWNNDYDLAIEKFTKAIEIEPNFWGCYLDRGLCKHELGDYEGAIQDFSRAIMINPDFAEAYNARGLLNFALNQSNIAIQDYQKALEINPLFAEAYYNRGVYLFQQGDLNSAYQDFSKAIEFKPFYIDALFKRGNIRFNKGDFSGASEDYTSIITTNYESSTVFFNRALAMLKLSDYDIAIKDFTKVIKLEPSNAKAFKLRAFAKEKIGDLSGAQEDKNEYERLNNV